MARKIVLIIIDGLGDKPIAGLKNKTPLGSARTPNLDWLAEKGICGLVSPVHQTAIPTSEESHLSLFGYDAKKYPVRRGLFTALGSGIRMEKGDIALRGNFATVDKNLKVIDRRAGRIDKTQPLIKVLNGLVIDGVKFLVKYAGGHRVGIVLRNKDLSNQISDGDPHYSKLEKGLKKIVPLDKSASAKFTAQALNKFLDKAHLILEEHSFNKGRTLPANYLLVRGASSLARLPGFNKRYGLRACCIAGKVLYSQIGGLLGMDLIKVIGADGSANTNLKGKITAAKKNLRNYDFVFLHIKAADSLAEDGDFLGKKKFIEKIDKSLEPLLNLRNVLIVVTADHSTCCSLKRHCKEPIPLLVYGAEADEVSRFSEKDCRKGKLGKFSQLDLMKNVLKLAKH